jgi:hypothetical protein
MYATAFFESDPFQIAESALAAIPAESQYAEMVRDLISWCRANPDDWEKVWGLTQAKYRKNPEFQRASNGGIDCKINGAYVLLGLLCGKRDLDQTILISCRCGQDSDCNPSSSGGVLFTTIGFSNLPERFTRELNQTAIFSHTAYSFPGLIAVCEKLARQIILRAGGRVAAENGEEVFYIPRQRPTPSKLELSWAPGPIASSRFTPEEMAQIKISDVPAGLAEAVQKLAPGWQITDCGADMNPGLRAEFRGKQNVLVTHPLDQDVGCVLSRTVEVPAGKRTVLHLTVGHDPQGDFDLIVRGDGKEILRRTVGPATAKDHWLSLAVDLSSFAGKQVKLELVNQPTGWAYEAAYWSEIRLTTD